MNKFTIYQEACNKVVGFQQVGDRFLRTLVINGKAKSTHENYLRQIAKLSLHYQKNPLQITTFELEDYMFKLIKSERSASQSSFKHLVYGLRKLYFLFDVEELVVTLPKIARSKSLPVVLSQEEVKKILKTASCLWEKILFALAYDTGVRISELVNLRIADVDLNRKQVHIRASKFKKDRYIPISALMVRGIEKHLTINSPVDFLFNHPNKKGIPLSKTRIRLNLKKITTAAGIKKKACVHTFRHTFATHQLEAGQNIVYVKNAMGHAVIQTTMVYLHIANIKGGENKGCLDFLFNTNYV